jgi:hypothetical protein
LLLVLLKYDLLCLLRRRLLLLLLLSLRLRLLLLLWWCWLTCGVVEWKGARRVWIHSTGEKKNSP